MSVQLRPMRDEEFEAWLPLMRSRYAEDMVSQAGMSPDRATVRAEAEIEGLFPGGQPSPAQLVYVIEAEGEPVGDLWLAERDDSPEQSLYIFDITVDEAYRGRGYGKAAMLLAEEEARRRGLPSVALNVFGGNTIARRLYQSLGYEERAIAMSKAIS